MHKYKYTNTEHYPGWVMLINKSTTYSAPPPAAYRVHNRSANHISNT